MNVSNAYKGRVTYPSGAYASTIAPYDILYTQPELSAHFYGGSRGKDVSCAVVIVNDAFLPVFGGPADFRYKPGEPGGTVPVEDLELVPNLMYSK